MAPASLTSSANRWTGCWLSGGAVEPGSPSVVAGDRFAGGGAHEDASRLAEPQPERTRNEMSATTRAGCVRVRGGLDPEQGARTLIAATETYVGLKQRG